MKEVLADLKQFAKVWNGARAYPTTFDLERAMGKKMRTIRNMANAYDKMRETHPELPELIWRRTDTGQPIPIPLAALRQLDRFKIDRDMLAKAGGLVVTSAQFGANIHKSFWKSLNIYSAYRDFPLVVMPVKYGPIRYINGRLTSTFPDELAGHLLFEDIILGKGEQIQLNVTRMRPTLERFLTDTICEMGGPIHQIFGAPVIELDHRSRVGYDYPKAIMTSGSVSIPNYTVDRLGQQDRTGEIALSNHALAAIVIEFDGNIFHFRQLMADKKGEFYDIDPIHGGARFFTPNGHEHRPNDVEALICGDWHTGKTCPVVRKTTFGPGSMSAQLKPANVVLHDFIDGDSVNHYEPYQASRRGWKAPKQYDCMETELKNGVKEAKWIQKQVPRAQLHMVASNHPEFLTEYIEELKWRHDDINLVFGAKLFVEMVDDLNRKNPAKVNAKAADPVVSYFKKHCPEINAMERTDKLRLGNKQVLCSMHGDIGPRGAPTRSLKAFRQYTTRVTLGHNHTGIIWGPIWRVGTSTPRMQFYCTTPVTQWTNTHSPIFKNGQQMLLNIIHGKYHGYKSNILSTKTAK